MESEKVKEIKKIATSCVENNKSRCKYCPKGDESDTVLTCRSLLEELLSLINELEEENERLLGVAKEKIYDIVEIKQLKDRINKLELENDDYKHRCEIIKGLIDSKRIVEFDVTAPLPPIHNIIY